MGDDVADLLEVNLGAGAPTLERFNLFPENNDFITRFDMSCWRHFVNRIIISSWHRGPPKGGDVMSAVSPGMIWRYPGRTPGRCAASPLRGGCEAASASEAAVRAGHGQAHVK